MRHKTTDAKSFYYGTRLSENITKTPEGYLICHNVALARTGDQEYLAKELGLDTAYGVESRKRIIVSRSADEVFSPATLASIEGKTATDQHPKQWVTPENEGAYHRGHVQNVRRGVGEDEQFILGDLFIKDAVLIQKIMDGLREVSCGYNCDYAPTEDGNFEQRNIRINHIAIVPNGRAGQRVAIRDSAEIKNERMIKAMDNNFLKKIFGIGMKEWAKDAEPEEVAEAMKEGKDCTKDEDGKKDGVNEVAGGAKDEGEEGESVMGILKQIQATLATLVKTDEKVHSEVKAPEASLDELSAELEGKTEAKDEEKAEVIEEKKEEAKDEEAPKSEEEGKKEILDAIAVLKPLIASLPDDASKRKVVDAFVKTARAALPKKSVDQDATYADLLKRKSADAVATPDDGGAYGKSLKEKYHRQHTGKA